MPEIPSRDPTSTLTNILKPSKTGQKAEDRTLHLAVVEETAVLGTRESEESINDEESTLGNSLVDIRVRLLLAFVPFSGLIPSESSLWKMH